MTELSETKELCFKFYFILIHLSSHMCLAAAVLDIANLKGAQRGRYSRNIVEMT